MNKMVDVVNYESWYDLNRKVQCAKYFWINKHTVCQKIIKKLENIFRLVFTVHEILIFAASDFSNYVILKNTLWARKESYLVF